MISFEDVLKTYKNKKSGKKALKLHDSWFPIKKSPELAGIAGSLIGDGHLQGYPKLRFDFTSKSKRVLKDFSKKIYRLFRISGKVRKNKTNKYGVSYNLGVNCKPLARVLILAGVPAGAKVLSGFSIPVWIKKNRECFKAFISCLFDAEGCVDKNSKCIEIKMHKSETALKNGFDFMNEIKEGLQIHFGIVSTLPFLGSSFTLRKDGIKTRGIRLKIKRKDSLKRFRDEIQFGNSEKQDKLEKILKN